MNSQMSLFHLYQTKNINHHPFRVYTRNNNIPLINAKISLINQEKSNMNSIEYCIPNSFRIELKQTKNSQSHLNKTNRSSLHQTINPIQPKYKSEYNSLIRNTQPMRNSFKMSLNNKKQFGQKKHMYFNAKRNDDILGKKENLRHFLYLQKKPQLLPRDNYNYEGKIKNKNIALNSSKKKVLKSLNQSNNELQLNKDDDKNSSSSKINRHKNRSQKSNIDDDEDNDSEVLSLNDVQDIIVYHDFKNVSKECSYLFNPNDFDSFIKNKAKIYLNTIGVNST